MNLYDPVKIVRLLDRHKNLDRLPYLQNYEDYLDKEGVIVYITHGYGEDRYIVRFADGKELCFETEEIALIPLPNIELPNIEWEKVSEI